MATSTVPPRVPVGKIVVPELPAEFVPRPQLRQLLDEASADQVIVVSAPAGWGKTLLLADWARSGEGPETAWISIDVDDNDPRRLWAAVVAGLLAVPSVAADGRAQRLLTDVTEKRDGDVVEALAAALDGLDPPVRPSWRRCPQSRLQGHSAWLHDELRGPAQARRRPTPTAPPGGNLPDSAAWPCTPCATSTPAC